MPHSARSHASGADVPALQLATSQVAAHAVVVKWKDRDVHGAAALLCIRLKVSNVFAANSERPGFPPSRASCAQTVFSYALRRFISRKNALALHLLLWDPESLIDIVVANEYPQNVF
jgi:hypothetical protein